MQEALTFVIGFNEPNSLHHMHVNAKHQAGKFQQHNVVRGSLNLLWYHMAEQNARLAGAACANAHLKGVVPSNVSW